MCVNSDTWWWQTNITAQEITKPVQRCRLVDAPLTAVFLKMQMIKISPEVTPAPNISVCFQIKNKWYEGR